jgi:uncharacterized protein with HEPN domain
MSVRSWRDRIEDILDALEEIQNFASGLRFEEFINDNKTLKAIVLDFIVIGEAANNIPDEVVAKHPEIAWHLMRGMRNRLVHAYYSIDEKIVWDTVRNDLPPLMEPLKRILEEEESSQ